MTAVMLFAKAPRAGSVKTRLAAEVGDARAVALYRAVGARVVGNVAATYPLTVWYDPPDAAAEMRAWLGPRPVYRAQVTGDLGARLAAAFAHHFSRGDAPVIAIGADAPGVTAAVIHDALRSLRDADVVVGPAVDGGYYLIGLTRPAPELFQGIPWSTEGVLGTTRARCGDLGLRVTMLTLLRDLDTAEDLAPLRLERT